jgi:hypothetical protein
MFASLSTLLEPVSGSLVDSATLVLVAIVTAIGTSSAALVAWSQNRRTRTMNTAEHGASMERLDTAAATLAELAVHVGELRAEQRHGFGELLQIAGELRSRIQLLEETAA